MTIALSRRPPTGLIWVLLYYIYNTVELRLASLFKATGFAVLILGLANMMKGGAPHISQKLMRLRVLLQFVAIVIIMVTIWAMGR